MARKIWETHTKYKLAKVYVDWQSKGVFSSFTVEGLDNIPQNAAVIIAPNHCATLTDALVVLASKPDATVFGARADLYNNPTMAKLVRFLKILPMARVRDGLAAVAKNMETFAEVVDCMANHVPFCIYPEGTHFPGYTVHNVKKGIFRIAEMAAEQLSEPVYIVPAGICYSSIKEFKPRLVLRYGNPVKWDDIKDMSAIERSELLQGKIQELVYQPEPDAPLFRNKIVRAIASVISLPLFVICAILASPIFLLQFILVKRLKDRAWSNTMREGARFVLPVFVPFHDACYAMLRMYKSLV